MHKPIEDGLEDYLSGRATESSQRLERHLAECVGCRAEFAPLVQQVNEMNSLLQTLRVRQAEDGELAPMGGFYGRVLERIESQRASSLWSVFLEPVFTRRLMYASLALLLVLTSAAWRVGGGGLRPAELVLHESNPISLLADSELPQATGSDRRHDREIVLASLVSVGGSRGSQTLPVSTD